MKTLTLLLMFSFAGCAPMNKYTFYKGMDPWNESFEATVDDLKDFLEEKNNRMELLASINQALDSRYIAYKNQIRITFLISGLIEYADLDEHAQICNAIKKGIHFKHLSGCFFVKWRSVSPPYILLSIEALRDYKDTTFLVPGHDGQKTKTNFKKEIVRNLENRTGKSFGSDWKRWLDWWETEGKFLEYDWEEDKYLTPGTNMQSETHDSTDKGES